MAVKHIHGFEHGVFSTVGGEFFADTSGVGTAEIITTAPRSGAYHLRATAGTGAERWIVDKRGHWTGTPTQIAGLFAVRFAAFPVDADVHWFFSHEHSGTVLERFRFNVDSSGNIAASVGGTDVAYSGNPASLNTWYLIEYAADFSSTAWVLKWRVAGVAQTDATNTGSGSRVFGTTSGAVYIGRSGADVYFDDYVAFDYADYGGSGLGNHKVLGYSPNAVGTHNLDAATSAFFFQNSGSDAALTTSDSTSHARIDDVPLNADSEHIKVVGTAGVFPTIPTVAAGRMLTALQADATATRTFPSLTGLTKNSGDLLVAICIGYQSSPASGYFSGWTAGWTEFGDLGTSTNMCIGAAYKFSTGSETGTISVTQAATVTGHAAMFLFSIPGAHASTPPEIGSFASDTTVEADPGSFNPTGWDVEDTLWIAICGSGETGAGGSYTGVVSSPTNYGSDILTGISGDVVGGVEGGIGFRQLLAASEDPGVYSVDLSNARNVAAVIAVRPAVATLQPTDTWYTEHAFADSAESTAPVAVRAIVAMRNDSGTTANSITAKLRANGNETNIFSGDLASASVVYKGLLSATAPGGAAWTDSMLDGATLRWGYSADADSTPRLESAMLEAAFAIPNIVAFIPKTMMVI